MSSQRLVSNRSHVGRRVIVFQHKNIDATLLEKEHVRDQEAVVHIFQRDTRSISTWMDNPYLLRTYTEIYKDNQHSIMASNTLNRWKLTCSPENIGLDCNVFRLRTKENTEIIAQGQVTIDPQSHRFTSADDVYVRGKLSG